MHESSFDEKSLKHFIRVTEDLIESILLEVKYRKDSQLKLAKFIAKRREILMDDYKKSRYLALNDNTEIKKSFPFLFEQLKYLNSKLLNLVLSNTENLKHKNNSIDR